MHLKPLDLVVLGAYFVGLFILGLVCSRGQTSKDVYFLGGRRVPWFLAGISVVATLLSTVTYVALPGEMIEHGVGFFTGIFAFVFIVPVVSRLIIPALMRLPVTSIYDYLERRFGSQARTLAAAVFVIMRLIWIGLIFYTASRAIAPMTGWSIPALVLVMGVFTIFYTALGGMQAVIWSDLAQFVILFGGAVLIPAYVALHTGVGPFAWWEAFSQAERTGVSFFSFDPNERLTVVGMVLLVFLWNLCTHSSDQVAAQRYLSTPSAVSAQRSFLVFTLGNVGVEILLGLTGLALFYFEFTAAGLPVSQFQTEIAARADNVLSHFVATELPQGLPGLILAALLAAAMSSLSSGMNFIAAVVVTDFLERFRPGRRHEKGRPVLSMAVAALAGLCGMIVAFGVYFLMQAKRDWNLVDLIETVNHLFVAPLGAFFFAGIWFRRAGLEAALFGFGAGVVTSFVVSFSASFTWILTASFTVSLAVTYVASFAFAPASAKQLEVLYRGKQPAAPS